MRACLALIGGDFVGAFMYNPFLFLIVIPLAVYMGVIYSRRLITKKWVPSILSSSKAAIPALVIILGVWLFRNIFPLGLAE
jgi:hypothetical protein